VNLQDVTTSQLKIWKSVQKTLQVTRSPYYMKKSTEYKKTQSTQPHTYYKQADMHQQSMSDISLIFRKQTSSLWTKEALSIE